MIASPLDAACARRIGKRSAHWLPDDGRVICSGCSLKHSMHARLWPECLVGWHAAHDHLRSSRHPRPGSSLAVIASGDDDAAQKAELVLLALDELPDD